MKRFGLILVFVFVFTAACSPSPNVLQTAVAQTIEAFTPVPTNTPYATYTPYPTSTPAPTIVVTKIVIQTPRPKKADDCTPMSKMDYSDNSKAAIMLQAYVSQHPGVRQVSYTIPEKLYNNSLSQLYYVTYVDDDDGKVYSKRYIVYMREFGWSNGVFSIDGQCWVDGPR